MRVAWHQASEKVLLLPTLIEENKAAWADLGSSDPYWSVLSGFKTASMTEADRQEFFASGAREIPIVQDVLSRSYASLPTGRCLDFGCGLGRVTLAWATIFDEAVGVDISGTHLAIARRRAEEISARNVSFIELMPKTKLSSIVKPVDFAFSVIALQHMHPDVSKVAMSSMARVTRRGGKIVFQIPTHHPKYDPKRRTFDGVPVSAAMFSLFAVPVADVVGGNGACALPLDWGVRH